MSDLSPAAQAVIDACTDAPIHNNWATKSAAAAVLRAVADQVVPASRAPKLSLGETYAVWSAKDDVRDELLVIADELDGVKYGTYRCNLKEK